MTTTKNAIRTVYLYLFALVGLALTMIGCVMIVNNLLKTYVFKNADYNYNYYSSQPMTLDLKYSNSELSQTKSTIEKVQSNSDKLVEDGQLTEEQVKTLGVWLDDYQKWSDAEKQRIEIEGKRDFTKESRDRTMATALSMIIVGLPVYLIHWMIIVRDIKKSKEFNEI